VSVVTVAVVLVLVAQVLVAVVVLATRDGPGGVGVGDGPGGVGVGGGDGGAGDATMVVLVTVEVMMAVVPRRWHGCVLDTLVLVLVMLPTEVVVVESAVLWSWSKLCCWYVAGCTGCGGGRKSGGGSRCKCKCRWCRRWFLR
jgi:hypothetical protein